MLALSMVMYAISTAHWALGIPFIKDLEAPLIVNASTFFARTYLPLVNVSVCLGSLAKPLANRGSSFC